MILNNISTPAVFDSPSPSPRAISIAALATGQSADVHRVVGRPEQVHRLEEFGLRRGARLQMFRPGNPCILRLAGSKVCLRSDAWLDVLVTPCGPH